ncbi:MAG: hypothetical protein MUE71_07805 [Chitinophagaceae bacterium]|nr:hypothetical protein [Chitinophagaceae bacterium]
MVHRDSFAHTPVIYRCVHEGDKVVTLTLTVPRGLTTHLGKSLKYREGLQASKEIITDNRRLKARFLSGIRKAVKR